MRKIANIYYEAYETIQLLLVSIAGLVTTAWDTPAFNTSDGWNDPRLQTFAKCGVVSPSFCLPVDYFLIKDDYDFTGF